jgi:hypothetical protein
MNLRIFTEPQQGASHADLLRAARVREAPQLPRHDS